MLRKLGSPKLLILLSTIAISLFYSYVPSVQTWVSNNMTIIENWEEETKMPSAVLIVFGILVAGGFVYLIYDALKESDTERIEKKLDKLIEEIRQERDERNNPKPKQ